MVELLWGRKEELELAKLRSAARQVRRLGINVAGTTDEDDEWAADLEEELFS